MADVGNTRARYRRILRFAGLYMVQAWWYELLLPRFGLGRISARGRSARLMHLAQRIHLLAVDLGGLMIKVGQFMSSRLDVLPPEITKELEGLQDEVPAVPFTSMQSAAEAELGIPLERAFAWVDPIPVAAASLGQAHRARLTPIDAEDTGLGDVIVKIQRPGIEKIVAVDLAALRRVAGWLSRVRVVADHVDLPSLVEEFASTSLEEIDYIHEAESAERFGANFAADIRVEAPRVAWPRTTRRVLTLEDVTAIKINDVQALRDAGIDPAVVAKEFAAVMFDQLFSQGFFHADPHPGNIFVTPVPIHQANGGHPWKLTFIDFGMMGQVPDGLRRGLRRVLIAAAGREGKGLVEGIQEVGMLLPSANTSDLERALTQLFDRFGGMGFAELQKVDPREFREFGREFSDVIRSLPFQLPENFFLIVRAMSLTSGMCSSLDPKFNIWDAVEPYAAQLLRDEGGNIVQAFAKQALSTAGVYARLPQRLDQLTTRLENGQLTIETQRLERRIERVERLGRRVMSAILFTGLFLGGILLRPVAPIISVVLRVASALPFLHAVLGGILGRRGRE
jgi:predicted unusual protein kinase regulating ubiquinone biosynthesis (AarF/ABC1/UbiB family)